MVKKHEANPLIEPKSIKPSREGYRVKGTFNAGAAEYNREIILLLRVAAGCFAKSSDRWYQWLISNKIFGPTIKNWHAKKCISFLTKIFAISLIIAFGGYSIIFVLTNFELRLLGSLLIATGLFIVSRIKVCRNDNM